MGVKKNEDYIRVYIGGPPVSGNYHFHIHIHSYLFIYASISEDVTSIWNGLFNISMVGPVSNKPQPLLFPCHPLFS